MTTNVGINICNRAFESIHLCFSMFFNKLVLILILYLSSKIMSCKRDFTFRSRIFENTLNNLWKRKSHRLIWWSWRQIKTQEFTASVHCTNVCHQTVSFSEAQKIWLGLKGCGLHIENTRRALEFTESWLIYSGIEYILSIDSDSKGKTVHRITKLYNLAKEKWMMKLPW